MLEGSEKMTNKDIYLSLNRQDETSVKKLLTNHKLEKEYTYNNDYIEVVLKIIIKIKYIMKKS